MIEISIRLSDATVCGLDNLVYLARLNGDLAASRSTLIADIIDEAVPDCIGEMEEA